jgi:hypothetical protein
MFGFASGHRVLTRIVISEAFAPSCEAGAIELTRRLYGILTL